MNAHRALLRSGFLLVLLALLTGIVIPLFRNPRMGLSAHLEGLLNGFLLILVGLVWPHLHLPGRRARVLEGLLLYEAFVNWGATALAAAWGTRGLTPQAAAGSTGTPLQEAVSTVLAISVVVTALAAIGLTIHALRPAR